MAGGRGQVPVASLYMVGGSGVRSERPLEGLPVSRTAPCAIDLDWSSRRLWNGEVALGAIGARRIVRCVSTGSRIVGTVGDEMDFEFAIGSSTVRLWSAASGGVTLTHLVADSVMPLLLSTREILVLHAAGLAVGSGCIAVLGESMAGKSTLAARWVARGGQFLSDDWLPVEVLDRFSCAVPSHPSIRLRTTEEIPGLEAAGCLARRVGRGKYWCSFESGGAAFPGRREVLRAIVHYRRTNEPGVIVTRRLRPEEAAACLLRSMFLLRVDSPSTWDGVTRSLVRLVEQIPFLEMTVPSGESSLDGLVSELASVNH